MFNSHIGPIAIFKDPEAPVEKQPYLAIYWGGGGGGGSAIKAPYLVEIAIFIAIVQGPRFLAVPNSSQGFLLISMGGNVSLDFFDADALHTIP